MTNQLLAEAVHSLIEFTEDMYLNSISDESGAIVTEDSLSETSLYQALHSFERYLKGKPLNSIASAEDCRKYRNYKSIIIW